MGEDAIHALEGHARSVPCLGKVDNLVTHTSGLCLQGTQHPRSGLQRVEGGYQEGQPPFEAGLSLHGKDFPSRTVTLEVEFPGESSLKVEQSVAGSSTLGAPDPRWGVQ
jgi:hypothetical protein